VVRVGIPVVEPAEVLGLHGRGVGADVGLVEDLHLVGQRRDAGVVVHDPAGENL
jgi:hypothetical protein